MSPLTRALSLLVPCLAGCAEPHIAWDGASPEDPKPSGPAYLRAYKEAHYQGLGKRFAAELSFEQFLAELDGKAVLYLGDHHADRELHERMLALLLWLARSRDIALGLEAIGTQDEPALGEFLSGELDLALFRDRIAQRWRGSWLDSDDVDKRFYRTLFMLAHEHEIPVFALEPTPRLPLEQRDAFIAERIGVKARQHTGRLIVVVVGHAHLLGEGKLIERSRLPFAALGARLSRTLLREFQDNEYTQPFLRTDSGMLFFNPAPKSM